MNELNFGMKVRQALNEGVRADAGISPRVAERLLARGDEVCVLDNFNDFYDPARKRKNIASFLGQPGYTLVEGDIRDEALVESLFATRKFDAVIHLAARAGVRPSLSEPILYEDVNCIGTLRLLEAARRHGPQIFLFGSSSSVYGINRKVPFAEDDEVNQPISPYATTKRTGELLCYNYHHLHGLKIACLRFFTVYGPAQRPEMAIHKFTDLMARGRAIPMYGDGESRRDYTFVDDIVDGILSIWSSGETMSVYHIGTMEEVSISHLAALIAKAMRAEISFSSGPAADGGTPRRCPDISKLAKLGYVPAIPLSEGIDRTVNWYRSNPQPIDVNTLL